MLPDKFWIIDHIYHFESEWDWNETHHEVEAFAEELGIHPVYVGYRNVMPYARRTETKMVKMIWAVLTKKEAMQFTLAVHGTLTEHDWPDHLITDEDKIREYFQIIHKAGNAVK